MEPRPPIRSTLSKSLVEREAVRQLPHNWPKPATTPMVFLNELTAFGSASMMMPASMVGEDPATAPVMGKPPAMTEMQRMALIADLSLRKEDLHRRRRDLRKAMAQLLHLEMLVMVFDRDPETGKPLPTPVSPRVPERSPEFRKAEQRLAEIDQALSMTLMELAQLREMTAVEMWMWVQREMML
jgi:hypothetical protein